MPGASEAEADDDRHEGSARDKSDREQEGWLLVAKPMCMASLVNLGTPGVPAPAKIVSDEAGWR